MSLGPLLNFPWSLIDLTLSGRLFHSLGPLLLNANRLCLVKSTPRMALTHCDLHNKKTYTTKKLTQQKKKAFKKAQNHIWVYGGFGRFHQIVLTVSEKRHLKDYPTMDAT